MNKISKASKFKASFLKYADRTLTCSHSCTLVTHLFSFDFIKLALKYFSNSISYTHIIPTCEQKDMCFVEICSQHLRNKASCSLKRNVFNVIQGLSVETKVQRKRKSSFDCGYLFPILPSLYYGHYKLVTILR